MITAEVVAHSTNWLNKEIITLNVTYPRCIHSELMTHRVFSRNSASSRAIPFNTMKDNILQKTYYPSWTKNQKGMQGEIIDNIRVIENATKLWEKARSEVFDIANELADLQIHKQNVNRLLEPFQYINVLITSTEWENFFSLRDHQDAQPEIQRLAQVIKDAVMDSEPKYLSVGDCHLPFNEWIDIYELGNVAKDYPDHIPILLRVITARCARISYRPFNSKNIDYKADLDLYNRLINSNPRHLSPTEHIARVPGPEELEYFDCKWEEDPDGAMIYKSGKYHSNLVGWIQFRKLIEHGGI